MSSRSERSALSRTGTSWLPDGACGRFWGSSPRVASFRVRATVAPSRRRAAVSAWRAVKMVSLRRVSPAVTACSCGSARIAAASRSRASTSTTGSSPRSSSVRARVPLSVRNAVWMSGMSASLGRSCSSHRAVEPERSARSVVLITPSGIALLAKTLATSGWARISAVTSPMRRSASAREVPAGKRTRRVLMPRSEALENPVGSSGVSARLATSRIAATASVSTGWRKQAMTRVR